MRLSRSHFLDRYLEGALCLAFVGMANTGKTHLSLLLSEEKGFRCHSVDVEMERGPSDRARAFADRGVEGLEASPAQQRHNLKREAATMSSLLRRRDGNRVLDTTGSVVHLPDELLRLLTERFVVVHLSVATGFEEAIVEQYVEQPTGMFWGDCYEPRPGESREETIRRCYPRLYEWRKRRYEQISDVTIANRIDDRYLTAAEAWTAMLSSLNGVSG